MVIRRRSWARGYTTALSVAAIFAGMAMNSASAASCHRVEFPDHVRVEGTTLDLNGLGVRRATFLRISVYVAALYVPPSATSVPLRDPSTVLALRGPLELVLHFVRGVGVRDIRNAFEEGFAAEGDGRVPPALAARVATLNGWMEDMRDGESMTFIRLAGRGIALDIGGHAKGVIAGDDFADALLRVWLGDHPPNPELKAGLLGAPCR